MILKPKTRAQLVEQLKALPTEKRKVIVLTGRHPEEGSINIGVRHHKTWEKHGAVTVRLPPHWTPPGFWSAVARLHSNKSTAISTAVVRQLEARVPKDEGIISFLGRHGIDVPVVNLHGTGGQPQRLEIIPYEHTPRWIYEAMRNAVRRQPRDFTIRKKTDRGELTAHPLEVLIEFKYPGKKRAATRLEKAVSNVASTHTQLTPSYLSATSARREDLEAFDKHYADKLTKLIKELANASTNRGQIWA